MLAGHRFSILCFVIVTVFLPILVQYQQQGHNISYGVAEKQMDGLIEHAYECASINRCNVSTSHKLQRKTFHAQFFFLVVQLEHMFRAHRSPYNYCSLS